MKRLLLLLFCTVSVIAHAQVSYQNPVIPGFYSDPSICRAGDEYYMVHSSMGYFPGVPIFHSKNLVDWKQIGYVLTRKEQIPLDKAGVTLGIFAPTIRYYDGVFYMITTNITAKGNFYVTAKDPAGEWSDPIWTDMPGIDPSLFFDDGKVYITSTVNWGPVPNKGIHLAEIDIKTGKLISTPRNIWTGTGARYPEGPHLYKKDGLYYLMIAEGGTEYGHKVAIARSKFLDGPYLSNPANPILTHVNANAETSPIQGVGHGDLVQTQDGAWFMVAHAFRQSHSHQILGRETFLAPVWWGKNAWLVINGDGTVSDRMEAQGLPGPAVVQKTVPQHDDFMDSKPGLDWNYLNNPIEANYSLTARKGYLRLIGADSSLAQLPNVTFIGRRQQHFDFTTTTQLEFEPKKTNEEAGLTLFKSNAYHYDLSVKNRGGKRILAVTYTVGLIRHVEKEIPLQNGPVQLRVTGTQDHYSFAYAQANSPFQKIADVDTHFLSSEMAGGFTGVYIGLYASGNGQKSQAPADFDWFNYEPK